MKVVIIGAGIAGLALANYLRRDQIEVVVNERAMGSRGGGHAFLMHTDGLSVLKELGDITEQQELPGQLVEEFVLSRPTGATVQQLPLDNWRCIKRTELTNYLYEKLPEGVIKDNRLFTHFIYEEGRIVAAAFENGEIEYGDLFVGADGGFSKVRHSIFGATCFVPGRVKEVVGVATNKSIANEHRNVFNKFQRSDNGLAFGMIPSSKDELVWFMQYDPSISDVEDASESSLSEFCHRLMADFPPLVKDVLNSNDFKTSYIWNTRDFNLLSSFSYENVVLIGDSAHMALPFTSAGTTNAMIDAKLLSIKLKEMDHQEAFKAYYQERSAEVSSHLELGRSLRDVFLAPGNFPEDEFRIPLIADKLRSR
jgi:2-polyprenyl-6-methoxyphenol hydroxylase-like FAD-dependent oxidoreductase